MLKLYTWTMRRSTRALERLLSRRVRAGKEDPNRLDERKGLVSRERPEGRIIWLHAASVGEAQSALIFIHALLKDYPDHNILVTTGTVTSAKRMQDALPDGAFHQYIPLDHPAWVARFLDHWHPDCVFWMESELWPNLLFDIKHRNIPAALVNARLSPRSFRRWKLMKQNAQKVLSTFSVILAQTERDASYFKALGAEHAQVSDNLKYSAAPLTFDNKDLKSLQNKLEQRACVLYASTHAGEEEMIARLHDSLSPLFPGLLSIIVPRHPERGEEIQALCETENVKALLRGSDKNLPDESTHIYIANTLGELGLFYRLADITYIGRSMSDDGGGGHNPLEAAHLNCAIVHGPNVQNLQDIYDDMHAAEACLSAQDETQLKQELETLLSDPQKALLYQTNAHNFSNTKSHVIDTVMAAVSPLLEESD